MSLDRGVCSVDVPLELFPAVCTELDSMFSFSEGPPKGGPGLGCRAAMAAPAGAATAERDGRILDLGHVREHGAYISRRTARLGIDAGEN